MAYESNERFFTMAETYHEMVLYLLPRYEFLQEELIKLMPLADNPHPVVVDLGGGSGILLGKILQMYPQATCYWVDFSPDFLRIAQETLAMYGDQVNFILSPLEENWESQIVDNVDAIVSMSAIHHLETAEKQDQYRRCYEKLNPGGWFFNADEMKTIYPDAYLHSLQFWDKYVIESKESIPKNKRLNYEKWLVHFENWRIRNIEHIDEPKKKGDDLHDSFLDQVQCLADIGFVGADLFIKYHLWSIIGGQKPEEL